MNGPIGLAPGAELADGRYRLERILGRGGMAVVWLGQDQRLHRPVAIKVISDALAGDPDFQTRFVREARLAAGLTHANLVGVYDYRAERPPFLVMEYVDGGTLADRLAAGRRPVPDDARAIARDLLAALDVIHRAGILHRDIKPANVLVGSDGRVRLTDFGIAQAEDATRLTRTGQLIGTLRYLAPEVVEGAPASPQSDLYALGKLIDEIGDGRLAGLVARLTDPDPGRRPRSAADALAELDRRGGPPRAARRAPARRLVAAASALLIGIGVVLLATGGDDRARPAGTAPQTLEQHFDELERLIQTSTR